MFRISILILEVMPVPETEVACFAAALETGCLILLVAKSTDKLLQPEMSVVIQHANLDFGRQRRGKRYLMIGSICTRF